MQTFGRKRIYTELEINEENLPQILQNALSIHYQNEQEIQNLIDYYTGKQEILNRAEAYSSGVNNKVMLNYAQSIVRDIVGYTFGKDIEYVQKKAEFVKEVEELNTILQYEDVSLVDITAATFSSICGVGYECTLPSDDYTDETPEIGIKISSLDPRTTFVVQSYDVGNPVLLACTYYKTDTKTVYTVYDKEYKTVYSSTGDIKKDYQISRKKHNLGGIPISIIENNLFLMGDYETALTVLDAINKVGSDSVNDIENFVQSLLVFVNATLGESDEERERAKKDIKENRIIEIKSPKGLNADAKYITQQLNPESSKSIREYLEESLWKIIGIPDRKTRSGGGGDTGDAVKLRDGWADIEVVARNKEKYFKKAKKLQLSIAINLLKTIGKLNKDLTVKDIDIKFSRNKSDNLLTKTQSYSTLMGTQTISPLDALEIVDVTTNVSEVVTRGEKYWKDKKDINQYIDTGIINTNPTQNQKMEKDMAKNGE